MKNTRLRICAQRDRFLGETITITMGAKFPDGAFRAAQRITFVEVQEGSFVEPILELSRDNAQELMDELWNCGLRPTEGTGSAGALAATQAHLNDMRAIAMHKVGVQRPNISFTVSEENANGK